MVMCVLTAHRHPPLLALAAVFFSGCGASILPTGFIAGPPPPAGPPTVQVGQNPTLGSILVASMGRTLYVYTMDGRNVSNCTGNCTLTWLPLTVPGGKPTGGNGVTAKLTLIKRKDGTRQVVINGQPLYLYMKDGGLGDAKGQGVANSWYAVQPKGAKAISAWAAAAAQATVQMATNPTFGNILVNAQEMTLYLYTKDAPGFSTCTGACAKPWPPLVALSGTPTEGPGVTGKFGTLRRPDGTLQVTSNGQPLYLYAGDQKPGEATGEGVDMVWFTVRPWGAEVGAVTSTNGLADGGNRRVWVCT